jgi:hypothetical protein
MNVQSPPKLDVSLKLTDKEAHTKLKPEEDVYIEIRAHHWATPTCHSSHNTLTSLHIIEIHKQSLSN